ncbi:MAG: hypothetical protein AAGH82_09330 [Pseudomonadota bacterium]
MQQHRNGLAGNSRAALFAAARLVFANRVDSWKVLGELEVDTLLVAGTHDTMYGADEQAAKSAAMRHVQFETLPTAHISAVDASSLTSELIVSSLKARDVS